MELSYTFDCNNCLSSADFITGISSVISATNELQQSIVVLRQDLNLLLELSVFSSILFSILLLVVLGAIWRQSRY